MAQHTLSVQVLGPWSLRTSKRFWEEFTPTAIAAGGDPDVLSARFMSEHDWTSVSARVTQRGESAQIGLSGTGDLAAAAEQVRRSLLMWTRGPGRLSAIATRSSPPPKGLSPDIARAASIRPTKPQPGASCRSALASRSLPESAATLSSRTARRGLSAPDALIRAIDAGELDLPGRKPDYLRAVAEAALTGLLNGPRLRTTPEESARRELLTVTGIGPFAADLVLIRGANAQDVLPRAERRLTPRSPTSTGPNRCSRRSQDAGAPSAPGPRSTSVRSEQRTREMG
jgi:DNA-3-methyladenine glycosylase II